MPRDLLERGEGGRGSRGEPPPPPPAGTYPTHRETENCRMKNSAHGNVMLSAVHNNDNKAGHSPSYVK